MLCRIPVLYPSDAMGASPSYDNRKSLQTLLNVPWKIKLPLVETTSLDGHIRPREIEVWYIGGQSEITGAKGPPRPPTQERMAVPWYGHAGWSRPSALQALTPSLSKLVGLSGTNLMDPTHKRLMCNPDFKVWLSQEKQTFQAHQIFLLFNHHIFP